MTSTRLRIAILMVSICVPLTVDSVQQGRQVATGEPSNMAFTAEQAEVWNREQDYFKYLHSRDLKKFMSLWDTRFVGWPDYHEHPARKSDIEADVAQEFRSSQPTVEPAVFQNPSRSLCSTMSRSLTISGQKLVNPLLWVTESRTPG